MVDNRGSPMSVRKLNQGELPGRQLSIAVAYRIKTTRDSSNIFSKLIINAERFMHLFCLTTFSAFLSDLKWCKSLHMLEGDREHTSDMFNE